MNAGKHGFIHFTKKEDGDKALQEMNKKVIDGNEIIVESSRPFDQYSHQTCLIDNINPETTEEDIRAALDNVKDSIVRVVLKKNNQIQGAENQTLRAILVYLNSKEVAEQVARDYNGTEIKGAKVRVVIARSKQERQQYERKLRESNQNNQTHFANFLQIPQLQQPFTQNMGLNPFGQIPTYPFGNPGQIPPYILPNVGMNQQSLFSGMNPNQQIPPQLYLQTQQQLPQQQQLVHQGQQLMQNPINPTQISGPIQGQHIIQQHKPPNIPNVQPPNPILQQQPIQPQPLHQLVQTNVNPVNETDSLPLPPDLPFILPPELQFNHQIDSQIYNTQLEQPSQTFIPSNIQSKTLENKSVTSKLNKDAHEYKPKQTTGEIKLTKTSI
ncbi:MAG: hypothetical protein EZS28_033257 [Streblomastix strix]|uniref:RRM domain-containing protein n=1 Tax=Streblomastix strix TaxID=222440 RepID=A0A5J4ULB9_9EUKA|nr:MAG: hypothetical protein EZS28_033257 [Streblomastix strix]